MCSAGRVMMVTDKPQSNSSELPGNLAAEGAADRGSTMQSTLHQEKFIGRMMH